MLEALDDLCPNEVYVAAPGLLRCRLWGIRRIPMRPSSNTRAPSAPASAPTTACLPSSRRSDHLNYAEWIACQHRGAPCHPAQQLVIPGAFRHSSLRGINRKDERLDPQAWLTDVLSRIAAHPGAGVHRESRRAHQNPQGIDAHQRALKSTTSDAPLRSTPDACFASG